MRRLLLAAGAIALAAMIGLYVLWWGPGPKRGPHTIIIQEGSSLGSVARRNLPAQRARHVHHQEQA